MGRRAVVGSHCGQNDNRLLRGETAMTVVITFLGFPDAYPHFPEPVLRAKRAEARRALADGQVGRARELNMKLTASQVYYDLLALQSRGLAADEKSLRRLKKGFMSENTERYRQKGEGARRGLFEDPDSRWYNMTRAVARDIILDEIYASRDEGVAETPVPQGDTTSAEQSAIPSWLLPTGGLLLALGLGYGVHKLTSRDTSPR